MVMHLAQWLSCKIAELLFLDFKRFLQNYTLTFSLSEQIEIYTDPTLSCHGCIHILSYVFTEIFKNKHKRMHQGVGIFPSYSFVILLYHEGYDAL